MLDVLEQCTGKKPGGTVIVDRGMACAENLTQIRQRDMHYIVAGRQPERHEWLDEMKSNDGWGDVIRMPSPRNPFQTKSRVEVKRQERDGEVYLLCRSEGRKEKDAAIREKHEQRLIRDLETLKARVAKKYLKRADKIHQAIGRLKERYPRVARYYAIEYDVAGSDVGWRVHADKKTRAEKPDGSYILKTDRRDLTADEIWRTYSLLTRVERAFRDMKSSLMERPIFHHLAHRTQTHIFLCVLAYHLLVAIEKRCLDHGWHTSWATLREQLSTHQVATVVLPAIDGRILKIRKASTPDDVHREIYRVLQVPPEVMKPVKTWTTRR
jgi:transposase